MNRNKRPVKVLLKGYYKTHFAEEDVFLQLFLKYHVKEKIFFN